MVVKNTAQLTFRLPLRYKGSLNATVRASGYDRAGWCRAVLTGQYEQTASIAPVKKFLFYDKVSRERARLSGVSMVVAVRLPAKVAKGIRAMAQRDGNNVSEWCGMAILRQLE